MYFKIILIDFCLLTDGFWFSLITIPIKKLNRSIFFVEVSNKEFFIDFLFIRFYKTYKEHPPKL